MLHFTCDLCGHKLTDERFVARVEVYPAFNPDQITEDDLSEDNVQKVAEMLDEMEITGDDPLMDCESRTFRFDLCGTCRDKYVNDPLGREALKRLNFSQN